MTLLMKLRTNYVCGTFVTINFIIYPLVCCKEN